MKTTLILRNDVVRQAKKQAADLGISLSAFVERVLRDALTGAPLPRRRRIVLPTSGHGLPKYDHTVGELKALENDDLDQP